MTSFDYLDMLGAFMSESDREVIKKCTTLVASRFDPCSVVQIGVEHGASVYCSRAGAPGATIYGVDTQGDDSLKGTDEQKEELDLRVIRGNSLEVWRDFQHDVHFLYIDGDHLYPGVSQDIKNWTPKILVGGIVGFHDALEVNWAPFVTRAINEWLEASQVVAEWEEDGVWEEQLVSSWDELEHSKYSRFFERLY